MTTEENIFSKNNYYNSTRNDEIPACNKNSKKMYKDMDTIYI